MAPPLLRWATANPRAIFSAATDDESAAVALSQQLGPLAARAVLLARDSDLAARDVNPEVGVIHPGSINNNAIFALFGVIGAGFVITGIWFFFWARNGGFYFKKNDWDDYKSTVLRRKGPNGTTLSGATPTTDLGGGSIYKDVADHDDDGATDDTRTTLTGITAGASDVAAREKRRRKKEQKERERERRREEKRAAGEKSGSGAKLQKGARSGSAAAARKVGPDGVLIDEEAEAAAQEQLRSYRHERPARVGGLNKASEGSSWDGSTNPTASTASRSAAPAESDVTAELMENRERTPTSTPTKKAAGGIRKVYSTSDRNAERENERIRAEARKLQEKGRSVAAAASSSSSASPRRDFSFQRGGGDDSHTHVPGSWTESEVGSDLGTKVYRHSLTGSNSNVGGGTATRDFASYAEEKRSKRRRGNGNGYRRGRDEDDD